MSDFTSQNLSVEDWSLQAIVRESSGDFSNKIVGVEEMEGRDSFFSTCNNYQKLEDDHDFLRSFSELFEASNGSNDELEELYKPFYTVGAFAPPNVVSQFQQKTTEKIDDDDTMVEDGNKKPNQESDHSSSAAGNYALSLRDGYTPKYKRRKNQHKRVVMQVSAEGLTSDMWAWRKYGQKPIKGSPYPRSYYRCSSLKGCLARKQVEQSCTEPGMFIVTYTAEHSHSKPTRRNSLAGTVRQKFPSNKLANNNIFKGEKIDGSSSRTNSPEAVNGAKVANPQARIKEEEQHQGGDHRRHQGFDFDRMDGLDCYYKGNEDDDLMFNGDFFSGLEEFNDFISGSMASSLSGPASAAQQFQVRL